MSIEAGVGYTKSEVDTSATVTVEDDTMCYYVNASLTLAPGVYVVPEIGVFDFGDYEVGSTSTSEGQRLYYGAKVQIDF